MCTQATAHAHGKVVEMDEDWIEAKEGWRMGRKEMENNDDGWKEYKTYTGIGGQGWKGK